VPRLVALGEQLQVTGGDATGFLARVQQAHPTDFWANFTLGKALHEKGKLEEGVGYYLKALEIQPDAVAAHNNIGHARYLRYWLEEADGAVENYRRALRIDPNSAPVHNNLGIALKAKGSLREAANYYCDALRIDPALAPAHFNLGEVLAHDGESNEAIDHYRQALSACWPWKADSKPCSRAKPSPLMPQNASISPTSVASRGSLAQQQEWTLLPSRLDHQWPTTCEQAFATTPRSLPSWPAPDAARVAPS